MKISELPIPKELSSLLGHLGYVELYPPQEEAIKKGVLNGEKVIITSPTASGKTLVALLAAAKVVYETGKKAVYLTPLRALANEKYEEFKLLESLRKPDGSNVKVYISTGDYDSPAESLGSGDIIVLTNEKFDSIIRHGASWLEDVQLYVADEVHLIGTPDRGPTLETIITKILTLSPESQIIALSATISNAKELARWLNAKLVDVEWRPVKLVEGIYRYGEIVFSDGSVHKVDSTNRGAAIDVAIDIVKEGGQSLIFTETRKKAVGLSLKASELTSRYLRSQEQKEAERLAEEILSIGEETELSRTLSQVVRKGSAFHHAGLSAQHRKLIEEFFRKGLIKVLTATPTLAAGVNLPARRVVINSIMRYDSEYGSQAPISVLEYKQMCGRAGRPRFDTVGETILIASSYYDADELLNSYVKAAPEPVRSQLVHESALRTHLLATISTLPGVDDSELFDFFSKTLLAVQYRPVTIKTKLSRALSYLLSEGFVERRGNRYMATEFGNRVALLYIDPATGAIFRDAISKLPRNKKCQVGLLHLVVSSPDFSPKFILRSKDWEEAEEFLDTFKDEMILLPKSYYEDDYMTNLRSLMVLYAWVEEWSEDRLLDMYGVEPGDLHRAVENADWLLYSLYEITKLLGRSDVLDQIEELRQRIRYGVKTELIPLTRLEGVGRIRARSLYNAGFRDLKSLSSAPLDKIAQVPKVGLALARKIKEQLKK